MVSSSNTSYQHALPLPSAWAQGQGSESLARRNMRVQENQQEVSTSCLKEGTRCLGSSSDQKSFSIGPRRGCAVYTRSL